MTAVLSLQHESDFWGKRLSLADLRTEYRRHAIEFRQIPIEDYNEADLEAVLTRAVTTVHELCVAGHTLLVHCNAGYNRAPTIAIAYLCEHHAMSLGEAVEHVKARRACVPYVTLLAKRYGSR